MTETIQDRWTRMHAAGMVRWMPGMAMAGDEGEEFHGGIVVRVGIYREHPGHPAGWHHDWLLVGLDTDGPAAKKVELLYPGESVDGATDIIDRVWFDGFWPVPDFNDPATRGCLLAQAREAWSLETLFAAFVIGSGRWTVFSHMANPLVAVCGDGASEPEALLDAIERAKGGTP